MAEKKTYAKLVTPRGILIYPKLTVPDTKFNPDGIYCSRFRLSGEAAAPMMKQIDELMAKNHKEAIAALLEAADTGAKKKAAKELKMADKPYKDAVDKEGEPTGDIEFNFKMPATFKAKNPDGTFTIKHLRPVLVDAKGKALPTTIEIWGGSEGKFSIQLREFAKPAVGAGVSLRLVGCQVLKLVSAGGMTAESCGFGEEEGYEAGPDDGSAPAATSSTPAADGEKDF